MTKNKLVLKFPSSLVGKPVISDTVKKFNLNFNILRADINSTPSGFVIIELDGKDSDYKAALEHLRKIGVNIRTLSKDIEKDDNLCTNCTACVSHCLTGALFVEDRKRMKVGFMPEKCVACEACIPVCPYKALSLKI
ncbi:MAG: NIL domain-containing protein [archaeon]